MRTSVTFRCGLVVSSGFLATTPLPLFSALLLMAFALTISLMVLSSGPAPTKPPTQKVRRTSAAPVIRLRPNVPQSLVPQITHPLPTFWAPAHAPIVSRASYPNGRTRHATSGPSLQLLTSHFVSRTSYLAFPGLKS